MRSIFIGSTGAGPGQTLATWALAARLKERGLKVGFFKPYGLLPDSTVSSPGGFCDPDVLLFKQVLEISAPDETLCPIPFPENQASAGMQGEELVEKIQKAYLEVSRGKDVVLIMGGKEIFFGEGGPGLSDGLLVKSFESSVLLIDRYQRDNLTFYSVLSLNSFLEGRVKSVILNHVPADKMDHVKTKVVSFLQQKGVKSAVAVPEDPILAALTVSGIADITGGEEKPVSGIILTGGKTPGERVVKVAQDREIPLILTRGDTFQVMERLEKARPGLTLKDEFKVHRFLKLIDGVNSGSRWVEELL